MNALVTDIVVAGVPEPMPVVLKAEFVERAAGGRELRRGITLGGLRIKDLIE